MAINKIKKETSGELEYSIKVSNVREKKDRPGCYRFKMTVNGIEINGCDYISYTSKEGEERQFVALPQYKGSDDKWYNVVYFKITDDLFKVIEKQLEAIINEQE